ncbi:hypothetical protein NM680_13000 [Paracoccus sp. PS-1]|uniref:hypothetical protein n=1 Tax=Paracoccus sp. PS1 TaxID=2963938 RepID=UPI0027E54279|nr:hypothetical protein [Paracoccus sp. PS1]MDQ7262279.1 hypothetical protein [Paracoccus sp. PS1]MDQ7262710.1 hypothetical protein [Paracoccus sp. PS1]
MADLNLDYRGAMNRALNRRRRAGYALMRFIARVFDTPFQTDSHYLTQAGMAKLQMEKMSSSLLSPTTTSS